MARQDFIEGLKAMGYQPEVRATGLLAFPYVIPVGKFAEKEISLGFAVGDDFPLNPPSGPHLFPHLLPFNPQPGSHPNCGIHASPVQPGWQYWSRPFLDWATTNRDVRVYMAHIRHLFDTL